MPGDLIFIVIFVVAMVGVSVWGLLRLNAINTAGDQRLRLLDNIKPRSAFSADALHLTGLVSYADHINAVFWRRDPRALYEHAAGGNPRLIVALDAIWPKGERL